MGRPQPGRKVRPPSGRQGGSRADGAEAVTPVIGAVLILAITIMGIAGVLYWGAPMIDRIQAQNAQVAMVGEFEDLRDSSQELSVPDHSRFPTIILPRGEVNLQEGSRVMVTAIRDHQNPNCAFHVTNWADTAAPTAVSIATTGCRSGATVEIHSVSGGTLVEQTVTGGYSVAGADFSEGDWLFRLAHDDCASDVCAEAWLHSGDQVSWDLPSSAGERAVTFDAGAIFSNTEGTLFLEKPPVIGDATFGTTYYGYWLRSLTASSYNGISGAGSHQVYLSLIGNYDRVDSTGVSRLRFDVSGDLAEAWCNALVGRTASLSGAAYSSDQAGCAQVTADGVRSVCYAKVTTDACDTAGLSCPTATTGHCFTFRFLHARIYTSLAI